VTEGDDGRVLLYCYAGCKTDEICQALGISMSDLFPATDQGDRAELLDRGKRKRALETLRMESLVLHLGSADLLDSKRLSNTDVERLREASRKVYKAMTDLFAKG